MPSVPPADVLVAIPTRKPVTHGLAEARDRVLEAARRPGYGRFDVVADGGCGKTRLLEELAGGLRDLGHATLFITISPRRGNGHEPTEADRMRGDEVTYHQIIADLASDVRTAYTSPGGDGRVPLNEETGRRIETRMNAAVKAMPEAPTPPASQPPTAGQHVSAERDAYVAGGNMLLFYRMSDTELLQARWSASMTEFVIAMREFAEHCPVAILVDDLHLLLGTGAGDWLFGVLNQLTRILIVHARRPDTAHESLGNAEVITLEPMSPAETAAYARSELPGWAPAEAVELGSLVHRVTGGYPVWVGACCQMIAAESAKGASADLVRERLRDGTLLLSSRDLTRRFGRFVDDYSASLLGTIAPVFELLTIMRRVRRGMLASLLAGYGLDDADCGRLFEWLKESEFMTPFDDSGPDIRMHDVIRHQAAQQLRGDHLTRHRYRELHASAERYYRAMLNFDEEPEEGVSAYSVGTRYAMLDWQVNSLEWLHHASNLDDEAFPHVVRAMIRLFLDAFWWSEIDFPMKDDHHYTYALLADYRALPRRKSGEQWLRYLEEIREYYVADMSNREPGRDGESWERARNALRGLWHFLRLDRATIPDDRELRRIQILLSIFRGDAEYFGGTGDQPSRDRASAWYAEAERAASVDAVDMWIANWARYFNANIHVDTDPFTARDLIKVLPERITEQEDDELRVYLIYLHGDLAWKIGDKAAAFDLYSRAVLHAYVFHLWWQTPQSPGSYTVEFYQMFIDWTRRRLDEARRENLGDLVNSAIARMNALFAPYWARIGAAPGPDNPEGFPRQPTRADFGTTDSPFAETVFWMLDTMQSRLEAPIDG